MAKLTKKYSSMDVYLFSSFLVASLLWTNYYISNVESGVTYFFNTTFVVGSYFALFLTFGLGQIYKEPKFFSKLFFFQTICLVGMAYEMSSIGALYMSIIPACLGQYHEIKYSSNFSSKDTTFGIHYFAVPIFMSIAFESIVGNGLILSGEGIVALLFICWATSTVYSGTHIFDGKSFTIFGAIRRSNKHEFKIEKLKGEKLFFHDIINQTHGINLFLNNRINKSQPVSVDECKDLVKEIKVIQSQIQGHYKFKHKNLVNKYDYVSFEFAKGWIARVSKSFLPEELVDQHFEFKKNFNSDDTLIYFPSFTRIYTNIIKNISEVQAYKVNYAFTQESDGLYFRIENFLFDKDSVGNNIESIKQKIIFDQKSTVVKEESGLGLESISLLCRELHGTFDFYFEDDKWVNEVFIPYHNIDNKIAA